ncbi:MAG: hypothetical protein EPN88_14885 [Bacteroidetes bacterium]|nr:MAG: hypothetical protein EPN88_14885 [Bacteroidota bacterium]
MADLPIEKIPSPKKSDSIYRLANNFIYNAYADSSAKKFHGYIWGYKESFKIMINEAIKNPEIYPDILIYPIMFNLRHTIELQLKELIIIGKKINRKIPNFPPTHDIWQLWSEAKKYIETEWKNQEEEISNVENIIIELSRLDESSFVFRYPSNKKGLPSLKKSEVIDLINLRDVGEKTLNFLEGSSIGLQAHLDMLNEFQYSE